MSRNTNTSKQAKVLQNTCYWMDIAALAWLISGPSLMVYSIIALYYNRHHATVATETTLPAEEMALQHWKLETTFLLGLSFLSFGLRLTLRDNFLHRSTSATLHLAATFVMVIGDFLYMASFFCPTGQLAWRQLQLFGQAQAFCGFAITMVIIMKQICAPESAGAVSDVGGDDGEEKRGGESCKVDVDPSSSSSVGGGKRHGSGYIQLENCPVLDC